MTDTASETDIEVGETDELAGTIPVDDWLEQAVTITAEVGVDREPGTDVEPNRQPPMPPDSHAMKTTSETDIEQEPVDEDGRPENEESGDMVVTENETEPAARGEPAGYHEEVDDADEGDVLIGTVPVATASDDYSATVRHGGRPPGRYRRRSVVSALGFAISLILLGGAAGYVSALYLPDRWTAEAEVVLDPGNASVDRHLATQQVLLESSIILDRALEELPVDRDYVEKELKTFPIEASTALGINFIDPDPELALDVVAAVLGSFMTEVDVTSADYSTPIYQRRIEDLRAQRQELERRLRDLEAANAEAEVNEEPLPYPAEVRRMALESEQLLAQINSLESAVLAEEVAIVQRTDAMVVTAPRVLTKPTWPNPLVFTALGLLVGLVVAVVTLFLLASRRVS